MGRVKARDAVRRCGAGQHAGHWHSTILAGAEQTLSTPCPDSPTPAARFARQQHTNALKKRVAGQRAISGQQLLGSAGQQNTCACRHWPGAGAGPGGWQRALHGADPQPPARSAPAAPPPPAPATCAPRPPARGPLAALAPRPQGHPRGHPPPAAAAALRRAAPPACPRPRRR
eukprot:1079177-Rhodomonas_salina.1